MFFPKKQDFWPRIRTLKGKNVKNILSMNDSLTKSAKIVLSRSIFDVKNRWNFFGEYQFRRPVFVKYIFFSVNF